MAFYRPLSRPRDIELQRLGILTSDKNFRKGEEYVDSLLTRLAILGGVSELYVLQRPMRKIAKNLLKL